MEENQNTENQEIEVNENLDNNDSDEFDIEYDDTEDYDTEDYDTEDYDTENDDTEDYSEDEPTKKESKQVPLSALQAERQKAKEKLARMEEELELLKQQAQPKDIKEQGFNEQHFFNATAQKYIDMGYDDSLARALAEDTLQSKREIEQLKSMLKESGKSFTNHKRDIEIKELKQNPIFSDIDNVRAEVEKLADKTGLTVKQSYLALYGDKKLSTNKADLMRQTEQEVLNNMKKKQGMNLDFSNTSNVKREKIKLTKDEMALIKATGQSPKEYAMLKKIENIDDYIKYFKKPKKKK